VRLGDDKQISDQQAFKAKQEEQQELTKDEEADIIRAQEEVKQ